MFSQEVACGLDGIFDVPILFGHVFAIICVFVSWSGGKLVLGGSKSVLERSSIGHSSGQFFCAGMRAFFGIRLFPPCSFRGFQAAGIQFRNTVADLSEAPPRAQWGTGLGTPKRWPGPALGVLTCAWKATLFVCVRDVVGLMLQGVRLALARKTVYPIEFQPVWPTEFPVETWCICHCGWSNISHFLVRMQAIHIGHGSAHAYCWTCLCKQIRGKHKKQWTCFEQINHDNNPGTRFWNKCNGTRFMNCDQFKQVACTDLINPQRPDDRPAAFTISFCLFDGHQRAEQTTKSQSQIYFKNRSLLEIDRKFSVMMQTVFGHPPSY